MRLNSIIKKLDWQYHNIPQNSTVSFLNPYSYFLTRKIKRNENINFIGIDGGLLRLIINLFLGLDIERTSFDDTSLAPKIFDYCSKNNKSMYFIGSTETNINRFVKVLKKQKTQLNVVGYRNGYFESNIERKHILETISKLNPDFVIVGMGTPYQENFVLDLKDCGYQGVSFTCGGYFHQKKTTLSYYPEFFDKFNLRWLYRIIDEPALFKRYFLVYPIAVTYIFIDLLKYSCNKN